MLASKLFGITFCLIVVRAAALNENNTNNLTVVDVENDIANAYVDAQRPANPGEVGFIASLRMTNIHFCSATILSRQWLVTAARCVNQVQPSRIMVFVGAQSMRDGTRFGIQRIHTHPQYDYRTIRNDIAMLRVLGSIPLNARVRSIPLASQDFGNVVRQMHVAGWGLTHNTAATRVTSRLYDRIQIRPVRHVAHNNCRGRMGNLAQFFHLESMCSNDMQPGNTCVGDTGGPLFVAGQLVGIQTWRANCRSQYPTIYVNVHRHLNFIRGLMNSN